MTPCQRGSCVRPATHKVTFRTPDAVEYTELLCEEHAVPTLPDWLVTDEPFVDWPQYVNAYELTRSYGGPEEGGWWYDVGTPVASIPCWSDEQVQEARTLLNVRMGPQRLGRRPLHHLDGSDIRVTLEDHFAEAFPKETPHYE